MFAEAMVGIGSFKTMLDMAKGLKDINDAAVRNTAVIELTEKIISAQAVQTALVARVGELEKDLVRFETWETEKERYQLRELPPGIFVRALKSGMENGEPPHHVCADCYNKGVKSLLHVTGQGNGRTHWKCHSCGFNEHSGTFTPPRVNRGSDWAV
jgi:ribosomal protein L37AE/L43A